MADLLLNARFTMRPPTGVDRVATELVRALREVELPETIEALRAVRPSGQVFQTPTFLKPDRISTTSSRLRGPMWEQSVLHHFEKKAFLLSLCNTGPVFRRRQIVMLHDAQVHTHPQSYARPFRLWYRVMQPLLARRAAMVLTVSEFSKIQLERLGIVPGGKARVVPNGADHILREPPDQSILSRHGLKSGGYFLALASDAAHKNAALLDRIERPLPLVLIGGDTSPQQKRGHSYHVGRVSDAELRGLYEGATAFLFPSLTEGFGLPPLEAMMCGCPVIASTGGAIPEVCGDAATLLDPHLPAAWSAAMQHIADNRTERQRMSQAGRIHAARYTWDRSAAILSRHISEAMEAEASRQRREASRHRMRQPLR